MITLTILIASTLFLIMVLVGVTRQGWKQGKLYVWSLALACGAVFLARVVGIVENWARWSEPRLLMETLIAANLSAALALLLGAAYRADRKGSAARDGARPSPSSTG